MFWVCLRSAGAEPRSTPFGCGENRVHGHFTDSFRSTSTSTYTYLVRKVRDSDLTRTDLHEPPSKNKAKKDQKTEMREQGRQVTRNGIM